MPKSSFSVVDVMKVRHDQENPEAAVKVFELPDQIETVECDVLIVGGGVGGVSAALAAAAGGLSVCVTEETDWLGGQITSQGVSVLDEGRNFVIETSGSNRSYQQFRERIRNYYRKNFKLTPKTAAQKYFNPGNCWHWVSQLAFEPQVGVKIIDDLIGEAPSIKVFRRCIALKVECSHTHIEKVFAVNLDTGTWTAFKADVCIDATELGDLLKLSGAEYKTGSEAKEDTAEPHASTFADKENVQDYVFPFVVDYVPGTDNTITKPQSYDELNKQGKFSFHGYKMFENTSDKLMPFWTYRRIIDKAAFNDTRIPNDTAVINWFAGNDFRGHNIIDKTPDVISEYLGLAKALSLSFLYWLQTEAPRDDGGKGYPEVKLRKDALGTEDGLSKYPYIREARRALVFTCIREQDLIASDHARARIFEDSVGIGYFPIDVHGKDAKPAELKPTKHFQIPLGSLVSEFPVNLILSCKNIGTTHIANGAYRVHPIEWAIGEAAGALARFTVENHLAIHEVVRSKRTLRSFQLSLIKSGVPLYWYDDVDATQADFEAIQFLSIANIMHGDPNNLHFDLDSSVDQQTVAAIGSRVLAFFRDELSIELPEELSTQLKLLAVVPETRGQFATLLYSTMCKVLT